MPTTFVFLFFSKGGGGREAFWPDTLTGLGLAAITCVGPLLSFLSVEIYSYSGPLAGHAS